MVRAQRHEAWREGGSALVARRGAERGTPQSYVKAGSLLLHTLLPPYALRTCTLVSSVCARPRAISHIRGRAIATRVQAVWREHVPSAASIGGVVALRAETGDRALARSTLPIGFLR